MAYSFFLTSSCLLGWLFHTECAVFVNHEEANAVLQRYKRYNSGRLEEVIAGNLERECKEELCSYEEAREVFENDEKTMEFWKVYLDGDQCISNPCKNGGRCQDDISNYMCWCLAGYEGKNCELDATCSTKNGGCKQFCRNDPMGKAVCSCAPGYKLDDDQRSCVPTVSFPCGKITAPEAAKKLTRSPNTLDNLIFTNTTEDELEEEEGGGGEPDNSTQIVSRMSTQTRVVGGTDSLKGEVPWQVHLLNREKKGFCGGSIINEKWIVTAAHCLESEPYQIVAGEYNVDALDHTEQYHRVLRSVRHPTYNDTNKYHNDIALLELETPLEFNHYVTPICLGDKEFTNNLLKHGLGTVSGWGRLIHAGRQASILQVLRVQFIDRPTCLRSTRYTVTQYMFCAGHPSEAKDTCQGDSGGPYTTDLEDTWFLTGITSWGEQCGEKGKYGIYTRISRYIKWIRDTTRLTQS